MKSLFVLVVLGLAILLQTTVGSNMGLVWPNIIIVLIVILSVLLPLDSLLLPTVLTGLISDYYSGGDFGLHIAYYLLIALVSKLVFRLGEKEPSTVIIVLLAIGFNLLYSFMRIIGTQHFLLVNGWITIISVLLGRVIITGLLTWALLPVIKTFYQRLGKWSHFYAK